MLFCEADGQFRQLAALERMSKIPSKKSHGAGFLCPMEHVLFLSLLHCARRQCGPHTHNPDLVAFSQLSNTVGYIVKVFLSAEQADISVTT